MHRWYILRSPSANATELGELMQSKGLRVFVPTEYRAMTIGQDKVWQQVPSRSDLLFVYGTYDNIHNIIKNTTTQFVHQSEVIQHLPLTAHRSRYPHHRSRGRHGQSHSPCQCRHAPILFRHRCRDTLPSRCSCPHYGRPLQRSHWPCCTHPHPNSCCGFNTWSYFLCYNIYS